MQNLRLASGRPTHKHKQISFFVGLPQSLIALDKHALTEGCEMLIKGGHGFAWSCCCVIPRCPSYDMMVHLALWDRCTTVLQPAPGGEAGHTVTQVFNFALQSL